MEVSRRFWQTGLTAALLAASALGAAQTAALAQDGGTAGQNGLQGMQSFYLTAPPQHYFAPAAAGDSTHIAASSLPLAVLQTHLYQNIYISLPLLRRTIAADPDLIAFWNQPGIGAMLQQAAQNPLLYSPFPARPGSGINPANSAFIPLGRFRNRKAKPAVAVAAPAASHKPAGVTTAQPGLLGQLQKVNPPVVKKKRNIAAHVQAASRHMISGFTTLAVSDGNGGETLYVLGSLPDSPSEAAPVNFTLQAVRYLGAADQAGNDIPSNSTVIDKQTLPAATSTQKYFCFVYHLAPQKPGVQATFTSAYWPDDAVGLFQTVSVARTSENSPVMAVPLLRMMRFPPAMPVNKIMAATPLGGSVVDTAYMQMRRRFAGRRKK